MSAELDKKLTLQDLIAKKILKDEQKDLNKDIYVESLEGTLNFQKPLEEDIISAIEKMDNGTDMQDNLEAMKSLIYKCCPMLRNAELQKSYEVKDPQDIVKELFTLTERSEIFEELFKMSGVKTDKLNEQIKN